MRPSHDRKRQNAPLKSRRKAPAKSGTGRSARDSKKSSLKSKPAAKSRPSSTTPQFSKTRVEQTLDALESQALYGANANRRQIFEEVVRRPTADAVEMIISGDWPKMESIIGCVAPRDRNALIWAAIRLKQYRNREADAQKRDNARKKARGEKPEPIRRHSHPKSRARQRT